MESQNWILYIGEQGLWVSLYLEDKELWIHLKVLKEEMILLLRCIFLYPYEENRFKLMWYIHENRNYEVAIPMSNMHKLLDILATILEVQEF